jgi:methylthioribose-1-phosphate isomerase
VVAFPERHFSNRTLDDAILPFARWWSGGASDGVTAAYGLYVAACNFEEGDFSGYMSEAGEYLKISRPTAVNLAFAVDEALTHVCAEYSPEENAERLLAYAESLKRRK